MSGIAACCGADPVAEEGPVIRMLPADMAHKGSATPVLGDPLLEELWQRIDSSLHQRHLQLRQDIQGDLAKQESALAAALHQSGVIAETANPLGPLEEQEWPGSDPAMVNGTLGTMLPEPPPEGGHLLYKGPSFATKAVGGRQLHVSTRTTTRLPPAHPKVRLFVESTLFTSVISVIIVANTVFIGLQVELATRGHRDSEELFAWTVFFTLAFIVELALRLFAYGRRAFLQGPDVAWNFFDVVVTAVSVVDCVAQTFALIGIIGRSSANTVIAFRAVRILRLCHLLKIVRRREIFKPLRLLVSAMMSATRSCLWLLMLLALVVYTFSLFFAQAATDFREEPKQQESLSVQELELIEDYFGTVIRSMYTLFLSMSGGVSWGEPSDVLSKISQFYVVLFCAYITFTFFIFLNVVTGVFCQIASEAASRDAEEQLATLLRDKEAYSQELLKLFEELDEYGSETPEGMFTLKELQSYLQDPRVQATFERLDMGLTDALTLAELFEPDALISQEEFLEGCKKMKGTAKAVDVHVIMHEVKLLHRRTEKLGQTVEGLWRAFHHYSHSRVHRVIHAMQPEAGDDTFPHASL